MKLKDILKEQNEKKKAVKLNKLLGKKYRNDIRHLLYRGSKDKFSGYFDIKGIRKNRNPRHTKSIIDIVVSVFEDVYYPEYPKRSESKFATPSFQAARGYGPQQYAVFPQVDVDVYSVSSDPTTKYFHPAYTIVNGFILDLNFNEIIGEMDGKGYTKMGVMFLKMMEIYNGDLSYDGFKSFLKDNIRSIYSDYKMVAKRKDFENYYVVTELFTNINEYFGQLNKGVDEGDHEVIFDGEKYLRVKVDFFKEFFEWSGNKWELKNET